MLPARAKAGAHGETEPGRVLQNEIFFNPLVRRFGSQLVTVKIDIDKDRELFDKLKVKKTPGIAVLKPDFRKSKVYAEKISPTKLAKSLRSLAKDKSMPK